jgi:integrase/recombinase XerD
MELSVAYVKFETYLLTEKRVSRNTLDAYKTDLEQFFSYITAEKVILAEVTPQTLKNFLAHLKASRLSARSMSRKVSTLKLFFSYLHEQCNLANSAQDLLFPRIEKRLPTVLAEHEIEALLKQADVEKTPLAIRNKIMLYLLYVSGMRISELTHLKISDIRFDTGFIAVRGKGDKERMIPVPIAMLEALKQYLDTTYVALIRHKKAQESNFLFPVCYRNKIKPISRQSAWMILKKLWQQTGNSRSLSPHILRHSLATHLLKRGANLRSLQLLLGHENLSTVQVYTHLDTGHLRSIYDKKHPRS